MLKQNYSFIEQQFHCDVCSEAITNPLCPICLTGEIEAWLTLYPDLKNELFPGLKKYLERIHNEIVDATQCIKCNRKRTFICPHCFIDYIFGELKKLDVNKIVFREFLRFFNYGEETPNPHAVKWAKKPWELN